MRVVRSQCRERLSAADFQFVVAALATRPEGTASLAELLTDPAARDAALDSQRLLQALLESPTPVQVSPRLYFYVLARRSLDHCEREVADYVASVLAAFLEMRQFRGPAANVDGEVQHLSDLLAATADASAEQVFLLREHIGDFALFLSGIFPEHIQHRATRRGAPDISFYEEVGSASYRLAAGHRLARQQDLTEVFYALASQFRELRRGLNRLADQLLCLEPLPNPLG